MSTTTIITLLLWAILFLMIGWIAWNYFRIKKAAKFVSNDEFQSLMRTGQIIDLREASEFHEKHILGARNITTSQLADSQAAIRKDKPVLLYDNRGGQTIGRAALILQKAGYHQVYVLQDGFEYWNGKTKSN